MNKSLFVIGAVSVVVGLILGNSIAWTNWALGTYGSAGLANFPFILDIVGATLAIMSFFINRKKMKTRKSQKR